jgi:GntR family transcriptional regulator
MKPESAVSINEGVRAPRYIQVYSALRDWILQGVYPASARLPSESELCDVFNVSRITTRSAVDLLVQQGMVERVQGRGTFVSTTVADAPSRGDLSELVRRLRKLDSKSKLTNLELGQSEADEATARDLQLSPGEAIVRATYTRERDGEPIGATEISIPARLGLTITPEDIVASPAPTLLEGKGFDILGAHQFIGAALADTRLANQLKTTVGVPVMRVQLLVLDLQSRPIELLTAHYRADRYVHHVFLAAKPGAQAD